MAKRMNVIISGTKTFKDYKLVCTVMKIIREKYPCIRIISGGAKGADKCGELYALKHKLPYMIYEPNKEKYGRKSESMKRREMGKISQVLVLFWDGYSMGSNDMLHVGIQYDLDLYVMNYDLMKIYTGEDILDKIFNDNIPF